MEVAGEDVAAANEVWVADRKGRLVHTYGTPDEYTPLLRGGLKLTREVEHGPSGLGCARAIE